MDVERVTTKQRLAALIGLALGVPLAAPQGGGAVAHLADGSSVPLVSWTLSYEYDTWKQGTPRFHQQPERRDTAELWLAKKSYPVKGRTLEITYRPAERQVEVDGEVRTLKVQVASGLVLVADGKRTELKLEVPHRDLILPEAQKGMLVTVRTLDLKGQTLTGTRREFCLLSFTGLVECPVEPDHQVLRVDFR